MRPTLPVRDGAALAEAIEAALDDREELVRRCEAAAEFARRVFAQERVFEETLRLYGDLGVRVI